MRKARKKIGIFSGYFLPHTGGVERYVDKLSAALSKIGYDIVIITTNHGNLKSYEKKELYSIYRLPIIDFAKERYPIPHINREYKQLINRVKDEKIDLFFLNTRFHLTSIVGARIGKAMNKPIVLVEHGTGHFTIGNSVLDFFGSIYEHGLTFLTKKYVKNFYGVSKKSNAWSEHFSIHASGVFYNAINSQDKKHVKNIYENVYKPDEIIIAYAGRLIKEKGILNLIDAFYSLESDKKVRLVIAGDGPLRETILKRRIDSRIDVLGKLDFQHVMALYKRADIFAYPSLYPEGLPTSILEAGLMECAVIATARGGTEEIIPDNDHGIIVDGTVDKLKDALELIIKNTSMRKAMGKAISKRVSTFFDWDAVAENVNKEFKKLSSR